MSDTFQQLHDMALLQRLFACAVMLRPRRVQPKERRRLSMYILCRLDVAYDLAYSTAFCSSRSLVLQRNSVEIDVLVQIVLYRLRHFLACPELFPEQKQLFGIHQTPFVLID